MSRLTNLLFLLSLIPSFATAQIIREVPNRAMVVLPTDSGNFVSWRFLDTDASDIAFTLERDGEKIAWSDRGGTNFLDREGKPESVYSLCARNGCIVERLVTARPWAQPYLSVPIDRPADGVTPDGRTYSYTPNDCSCADLDFDGEYEIILKWDPSNSHDNSHQGYTGNVIIDAYKINYSGDPTKPISKRMWRIDLGKNIRAGAHYTQFMVYDFNGDGFAEMICKTAPGSIDGLGTYVNAASMDPLIQNADNSVQYAHASGHILSGPEYLTVFDGQDGHAIHTIFYTPNRAFGTGGSAEKKELAGKDAAEYDTRGWGDKGPGNRGERYLACVASLDDEHNATAIMCRGYYTRSYLWAVDFDGRQLSTRWLHASISPKEWKTYDGKGNLIASGKGPTAYGQGAHSIAVGDVDDDGFDEIMYGSAAIDHDGKLLYSTALGHGDAQHLADLDPDRPGLEYFMVHEAAPYGCSLRDARTGELLFHKTANDDTGRGLAADIDPEHRGSEFWCSAERAVYNVKGEKITETEKWTPQNFRIYWDGDLQDELIGNGSLRLPPGSMEPRSNRRPATYFITKWNGEGCEPILLNGKMLSEWGNSMSCNGTKATPCLQADLFGDWREELVLFDNSDKAHLNIFTTNIPSPYRVITPMQDHIYRMGIVWQNVAYNQPPHPGYYLPKMFGE